MSRLAPHGGCNWSGCKECFPNNNEESNMNDSKSMEDKAPVVPFYTVGVPDCGQGCCTPVSVTGEFDGPIFYVETEYKAQLAAQLLGLSEQQLEIVLAIRDGKPGIVVINGTRGGKADLTYNQGKLDSMTAHFRSGE